MDTAEEGLFETGCVSLEISKAKKHRIKAKDRDFSGRPIVKLCDSPAGVAGSIPVHGTKTCHMACGRGGGRRLKKQKIQGLWDNY